MKMSNGLEWSVLSPAVRQMVVQRGGGGGGRGMNLAAVSAGRRVRGALEMQAGLSGAAQLPH